DHRAGLRVRREIGADDAFGRHATRRLRRLGAALDAPQLLRATQVADAFGQRLLAFHHAEAGALAQFHHSARGDIRHLAAPYSFVSLKTRGPRPPVPGEPHYADVSSCTSTNSSPDWTI